MHRAEPVSNKLVVQKSRDQSYIMHREKLTKVKASIDNRPPKSHPHLQSKAKKIQVEKERLDSIQRDNHKLLNKMSDIMQKNYLDNKNTSIQYAKSLNSGYRKREMMRITAENHAILKRIQQKQPVYNHMKWEYERKQNELYCKNICEYNYVPKLVSNATKNFLANKSKQALLVVINEENPDDQYAEDYDEGDMEDLGGFDIHDEYYRNADSLATDLNQLEEKKQQDEIINELLQEHHMDPLKTNERSPSETAAAQSSPRDEVKTKIEAEKQEDKNKIETLETESKGMGVAKEETKETNQDKPPTTVEKPSEAKPKDEIIRDPKNQEGNKDNNVDIQQPTVVASEKKEEVKEKEPSTMISDTNLPQDTIHSSEKAVHIQVEVPKESVKPVAVTEPVAIKETDKTAPKDSLTVDNKPSVIASQESFSFDDDPLDDLEDFDADLE